MNKTALSTQASLSIIIRPDWKWWLSGAIFSFVLASVLMTGWPSGLFPNPAYPFTYNNDGAFSVIQRLIEGWIFNNPRSGYPFGSNLLDYPSSDSGNYLLLKLIGSFTGEWYSAHNIYFLLGFSVSFVAAFCVLQSFGLAKSFAFTAATLFVFLPFHFLRLEHLFFTWYFVVPIFYYIALRFFNSSASNESAKASLSTKVFYALCLISLGTFGIYYALFGLILFMVVAIYEAVANYNSSALKVAFMASSLVFFGVLLNVAPNLIHQYSSGKNIEVAQRGIADSEIYGFKFAQLILPRSEHRIAGLANISTKYRSASPLINENVTSSLGVVGSLGFLAVFGIIVLSLAGRLKNRTLNIVSLIVLTLFMFGTIGGFGSIFAQTITTSIRGWNRISIFIGFGALLVIFMLLQAEIQKRFSGRRLVFMSSFISIVFLMGGLYDQTVPPCKACNEQTQKVFNMDREFVRSIEKSVPIGSAVYQLPYMPFPEVPPLHRLKDYALSVGFLHSTSLHWSYGGMKGRPGDLFYRSLAKEPLKRQLEVISRLGFAGVYVDRRGYDDNDHTVIDDLTALLGAPPTLTRADGEVVFFQLNQEMPHVNLDGISAEQIMKKAGYIVDHLGARHEATFTEGIDFTRPDFPIFVKDVEGLSGSEPWGRWSDANLAPSVRFDLQEQLPNHFNLVFSAQPFGPNLGQDLEVSIGTQTHHFNLHGGLFEYRKMIDLGGRGVSRIEFLPPKPASPRQLNINSDPRMLGIGLIRLRFEEKDAPDISFLIDKSSRTPEGQ